MPSFQNSLAFLFYAPHSPRVPVSPGPGGGAWLVRAGRVTVFDSFSERVPVFLGGHVKQT